MDLSTLPILKSDDIPTPYSFPDWMNKKGFPGVRRLQIIVAEPDAEELYSTLADKGWGWVSGTSITRPLYKDRVSHSIFLYGVQGSYADQGIKQQINACYLFRGKEKKRTISLDMIPLYEEVRDGTAMSITINPGDMGDQLSRKLKERNWKWGSGIELRPTEASFQGEYLIRLHQNGIQWGKKSETTFLTYYLVKKEKDEVVDKTKKKIVFDKAKKKVVVQDINTNSFTLNAREIQEKPMTEKLINGIKNLLPDLEAGAVMAAGAEAAELLVTTAHSALEGSKSSLLTFLKDPRLFNVQAAVLAAGVKIFTGVYPNVPYAKEAKAVASLALQFETATLLKPLAGKATEFVKQLGQSGAHLIKGGEVE